MKPIQRVQKTKLGSGRGSMQQEFGFGSDFIRRVARHLEPVIQKLLSDYFKAGARGALIPPRHIPQQLAKKAILEILNPKYFWRDFILHPDILLALREDYEYDYWEKFLTVPNFLQFEENLLRDWQTRRTSYYQFAHSNTQLFLEAQPNRLKGVEKTSYLALMAAYRYLDAAITGRQNLIPNPSFGGEDGLEFTISVPCEGSKRKPLGIRIGNVRRAEYGTSFRNTDQILLEALFAEANPASDTFNTNNCVVQVSRLLCPLLTLVTQDNFPDDLILDLLKAGRRYQEINISSPLPEHDLGNTRLHLGRIQHLEARFSKTWFSHHALPPLWLDMSGFRPFRNTKISPIVEELNNRYREVMQIDKTPQKALVWARTQDIILLPVLNRCLQLRCLQLLQVADPQKYQSMLEDSATEAPDSEYQAETHLFQLDFCFRKSLEVLSEAPHKTLELLQHEEKPEIWSLSFRRVAD